MLSRKLKPERVLQTGDVCHPPGSGPALGGAGGFARNTGPQPASQPASLPELLTHSLKPVVKVYHPHFKEEGIQRGVI